MAVQEISIQSEDFDVSIETKALTEGCNDAGAVVTFIGIVRGDNELKLMRLEHYPAMTAPEIGKHIDEAKRRWPIISVRVIHRIGELKPGENIVFVGVASAHRRAAFEATDFLMDYLKSNAPFWKFEERSEGGNWVKASGKESEEIKRWR